MNIIELAREAGMEFDDELEPQPIWYVDQTQLIRFAHLVRNAALEEVADMVGACDPRATPKGIAAAIRAMKEGKDVLE